MLTLFLSACGERCPEVCPAGDQHCIEKCTPGECVEADDWGYPKVWVPAGDTDVAFEYGYDGGYSGQTMKAIDSGQRLLNAEEIPLVMSIGKQDQWTSWFSGEMNNLSRDNRPAQDENGWDGGRVVPFTECEYYVTNGASPGGVPDDLSPATIIANSRAPSELFYYDEDNPDADRNGHIIIDGDFTPVLEQNSKTPCYFRYGMGLYVGLAPDGGLGTSKEEDVLFAYHIPDAGSPDVPNNYSLSPEINKENRGLDGYLVNGFPKDVLPGAQTNDRLFFKIVDSYYADNDGGYTVKIKEGTRDPNPGPLEYVTNLVLEPTFVIMERIYEGIRSNIGYINAVRGALVLYIVFYAFQFIIGGVEGALKKGDVVMRVIKIAIIVQLMSDSSWDFFYNNLFQGFVYGVGEIAGLLLSPFQDYDPQQPWYSMDRLLARFMSEEAQAKIWSTLFSNYIGFIYVILIWLAFAIFVIALLKAVIVYIVALMGIAILVAMAPIFIVFILFDKTAKLWKEITNQLLASSIEIIMLLAALGMFGSIIIMFLERTLGYNVCWNVFADLHIWPGWSGHIVDLRFWMPDIGKEMANIWMDANGDGIREVAPPETAYRYVDLPYLDPYYDQDIITRYQREENFLEIIDILIFFGAIYLMAVFMYFIPTMSDTFKGGADGGADSASVFAGGKLGSALFDSARNITGNAFGAAKAAYQGVDIPFTAKTVTGEDGKTTTKNRRVGVRDDIVKPIRKALTPTAPGKAAKAAKQTIKDKFDKAIKGRTSAENAFLNKTQPTPTDERPRERINPNTGGYGDDEGFVEDIQDGIDEVQEMATDALGGDDVNKNLAKGDKGDSMNVRHGMDVGSVGGESEESKSATEEREAKVKALKGKANEYFAIANNNNADPAAIQAAIVYLEGVKNGEIGAAAGQEVQNALDALYEAEKRLNGTGGDNKPTDSGDDSKPRE